MDQPGEPGRLQGQVAAITGQATTVVVGDGKLTWTCNLRPDKAVSASRRVPSSRPRPGDFAVADNLIGGGPPPANALPQPQLTAGATASIVPSIVPPESPQELVWGGGALPRGVTSVTYTFPDGHIEAALTRNGYWVNAVPGQLALHPGGPAGGRDQSDQGPAVRPGRLPHARPDLGDGHVQPDQSRLLKHPLARVAPRAPAKSLDR
jgi:hypothetical protein